MYSLARQLLFQLDEERSHSLALKSIDVAGKLGVFGRGPEQSPETINVFGIDFPNRVGLAAGLDKNADHINGLASLGFGFIEVGTVTPKPQAGNDQPRLFRLPQSKAIINRMGFNNHGLAHLRAAVERSEYSGVLGINIGKNKLTPEADAANDYVCCMREVYSLASYITVNLSSPNTPGLRDLQFGEPLRALLSCLKEEQQRLAQQHGVYKPMLIKIAPDMSEDDLLSITSALREFAIDGVIATNTTLARDQVAHLPHGDEAGGLSGGPLTKRSTEVIARMYTELRGDIPIIGVGGIMNLEDAQAKVDAGAELVQIYSGFIYEGPSLVRRLGRGLQAR